MQKTIYEDYKYSMQDVGRVYVGCKYTLGELLEAEEVSFKFRLVVQRHILPEGDREKKGILGGRAQKQYVTKQMGVEELAALSPKEKEQVGLVIQEISVSKLALSAF